MKNLIIKFVISYLICYIGFHVSESFLSGGICGVLCLGIQIVIDNIQQQNKMLRWAKQLDNKIKEKE